MTVDPIHSATVAVQNSVDPARLSALRASAEALEASFLAEMLRHSGVAKPPQTGGGGAGEDAFAGFLADEYADRLVKSGGIGLSEQIFQALVAREDAAQ
ncbi:MAG: rod-binding protein [Pseudomonadota bacterium]